MFDFAISCLKENLNHNTEMTRRAMNKMCRWRAESVLGVVIVVLTLTLPVSHADNSQCSASKCGLPDCHCPGNA
jgi:hypothetical protein